MHKYTHIKISVNSRQELGLRECFKKVRSGSDTNFHYATM